MPLKLPKFDPSRWYLAYYAPNILLTRKRRRRGRSSISHNLIVTQATRPLLEPFIQLSYSVLFCSCHSRQCRYLIKFLWLQIEEVSEFWYLRSEITCVNRGMGWFMKTTSTITMPIPTNARYVSNWIWSDPGKLISTIQSIWYCFTVSNLKSLKKSADSNRRS